MMYHRGATEAPTMQRTNIYLDEQQLKTLRHLAAEERSSVAQLVRRAVDDFLTRRAISDADRDQRFDDLLVRMRVHSAGIPPEEIEADITAAREEVRAIRRAQRAAGVRVNDRPGRRRPPHESTSAAAYTCPT
jgi:hypothetical protein